MAYFGFCASIPLVRIVRIVDMLKGLLTFNEGAVFWTIYSWVAFDVILYYPQVPTLSGFLLLTSLHRYPEAPTLGGLNRIGSAI